MNMLDKRMGDESITQNCFRRESDSINVYLNKTKIPDSEEEKWSVEVMVCNRWGDELLAHNEHGIASCNCNDCQMLGSELYYLFGWHSALRWLKKNVLQTVEINVFTDSDFLLTEAINGLGAYGFFYKCQVLNQLEKEVDQVLKHFDYSIEPQKLS